MTKKRGEKEDERTVSPRLPPANRVIGIHGSPP